MATKYYIIKIIYKVWQSYFLNTEASIIQLMKYTTLFRNGAACKMRPHAYSMANILFIFEMFSLGIEGIFC